MRGASMALACSLCLTGTGCAAFAPQVGVEQDSCPAGDDPVAAPSPGSGYGASTAGTASVSATAEALVCSPDAGAACDACEGQFCCATRLACYEDPVCHCADDALDSCTDAAGTDPTRTAACYAAFTGAGIVEQARMECLRTWCQVVCALP